MDWVKLLISALVGLVSYMFQLWSGIFWISFWFRSYNGHEFFLLTDVALLTYADDVQVALFGSTEVGEGDVWVLLAILGGIVGYIVKIYFTYVILHPEIHFQRRKEIQPCTFFRVIIFNCLTIPLITVESFEASSSQLYNESPICFKCETLDHRSLLPLLFV